jgi:hypothetical protein
MALVFSPPCQLPFCLATRIDRAGPNRLDRRQGLAQDVQNVDRLVDTDKHDPKWLMGTRPSFDDELERRINRENLADADRPTRLNSEAVPFLWLNRHPCADPTPGNGHGRDLKRVYLHTNALDD